ncbi:MAG: hypothetical protein QM731_16420 [Chitinophagaceae bacterium]
MKIKPLLPLFLLLTMASVSVVAQDYYDEPKKGFDKTKLFGGGNFGLSFGDYTLVNVSPQLGYHFNKYIAAGAGVNFIYSSFHYYSPYEYRQNYGVAGMNIFGRVYPIEFAFLQLQPELNYVWGKEKYYDGTPAYNFDSKFVPSLLGGVGGAIPTGPGGAFIIMAQYDLLQNSRSPYGNRAFISFGYNMGF